MLCGLPDIHAAVNRIAEIGSVNTSKVRRTLLDQWLASTTTIHQQETTDVTMIADDSLMTDSSAPATNDTHVSIRVDTFFCLFRNKNIF